MPLMQWDTTMSVGVTELDAQHKELIHLINESYEAIQRHDERLISTLIQKMRAYAILHFETEERFMQDNDFPTLEAHRKQHRQFTDDVDAFQQNMFQKTNLSQIFLYLSRWLTNHIMVEDKQYMK